MNGGPNVLRFLRPADGPAEDLSALSGLQLPPTPVGAETPRPNPVPKACRCCSARENLAQVVVTFYRQGAAHNVTVSLCAACAAADCQPMDEECRKPLPLACLDTPPENRTPGYDDECWPKRKESNREFMARLMRGEPR